MTPSIWDGCIKKLVIPQFIEAVNFVIKLFSPDQTDSLFFSFLGFFRQKIEFWEPKNHNFGFFSQRVC